MSNVVRNSILLSVFFILIIVFRFSFENKMNQLRQSLSVELDSIMLKLDKTAERRRQIENAQYELSVLREKQLQQTKVLRKEDSPTITLDYILALKKMISKEIFFDFAHLPPQADSSANYNVYTISGEIDLNHLKKLIYHFEQQKPIYTLPALSLSGLQVGVTDSVRFSLTLHSYFDKSGSENDRIKIEPKFFPYSDYQLFKMRVYHPTQKRDNKLPDCERIDILAMTEEFIVFRNSEHKLTRLQPGDSVQLGRFKEIRFDKKEAVFVINKIGIWETVIVPFQGGIK